jgi:hypothetical protein
MEKAMHAAQENRVRRLARRAGLALRKSRTRNPELPAYGTFMIVDPFNNTIVSYGLESGFGLTLDEAEEQLVAVA